MPEPNGAAWTDINTADWAAGQFIRETKFKQQLLQNLQFMADTHNHDGTANRGGTIAVRKDVLANRPASGSQGEEFYATDLGAKFLYDSRWRLSSHVPSLCERFTEDFILNPTPALANTGVWYPLLGALGGVRLNNFDRSEAELLTGANASGRGGIRTRGVTGAGSGGFWKLQSNRVPAILDLWFRAPGASNNARYMLGLMDAAPALQGDPANGIWIRQDGAGNWFSCTRASSGTVDAQDLTNGPTAGYVGFTIVIESVSSIKFYSGATLRTTHTGASLPTGANLDFFLYVDNKSAANQVLLPDYLDWAAKRQQ